MGEMIRLKFIEQSKSVSVWDGVTFDTSWQNNTTVDSDGYTVAHITSAEQAVTLWRENVVQNWQDSVSNRKIKIVLDTSVQFNASPDNWTNHPSDTWQHTLDTYNQGEFILDGNYHSIIGLFCKTPTSDNNGCFFNIWTSSTIKNIRFHKCSSSINSGNARSNIAFVFSTLTLENVIFDRLYLYNRGSSYCQIGVNHWNGNGNTIYANNVVFSNVTVDVTREPTVGSYSLLGGSITNWSMSLSQYLYADNIIYHNCTASTRTVYLIGNKSGNKTPTAQEYQVTNVEYLDNTGLTANYGSESSSIDTMVSDYNAIADEDINSTGDGFDGISTDTVEYYLLAPTDLAKGFGLRYEIPEPSNNLVYLAYFDDIPTTVGTISSVPLVDTVNMGNMNSISSRFKKSTITSVNGTMPSSYVGLSFLDRLNGSSSYKNDGLTWNFPYTQNDKFTVMWWAFYNQRTCGSIGPQVGTQPQYDWSHSFRNHFDQYYGGYYWYADTTSSLTGYNGGVVSADGGGGQIRINKLDRATWHHLALVSDGSDLHFYIDGVRYGKRAGSWQTGDFTKFLMFDDEAGSSSCSMTELAIYDGDLSINDHNNIQVPTNPIRS